MWKSKGLADWTEGNTAFLSVVFSWRLADAFQRAIWHKAQGYEVKAGGPAVKINPGFLSQVADVDSDYPDAIAKHNPNATFTSRGCIRSCVFCAVPKMEGDLIELDDWPIRPIVCDNNLLACSKSHFDSVIDKLKPLKLIDINQGMDARLLTKYHAERLAELNMCAVRLAWDHSSQEKQFKNAYQTLIDVGFPPRKIRAYVLIGFNDDPNDALYRLEVIRRMGSRPNPMRYQPLDAEKRNSYVSPKWTERELKDYMRYWSRLRWLEHIPFEEYCHA